MQENANQNNSKYRHIFTQCSSYFFMEIWLVFYIKIFVISWLQEFLLKDEIAAIDADNSQKKENPKYEPMVKFENVVASWDEVSNVTIAIWYSLKHTNNEIRYVQHFHMHALLKLIK